MSVTGISSNPLFAANFVTRSASVAPSAATNDGANSAKTAAPSSILPPSSATPLSFDTILTLQSEPSQSNESAQSLTASADQPQSAVDRFLAEAHKDPMQRMREQVMKQLGISDDDLNHMSADDRRAAEDKIRKLIEEKFREAMKGDKGPAQNNTDALVEAA